MSEKRRFHVEMEILVDPVAFERAHSAEVSETQLEWWIEGSLDVEFAEVASIDGWELTNENPCPSKDSG